MAYTRETELAAGIPSRDHEWQRPQNALYHPSGPLPTTPPATRGYLEPRTYEAPRSNGEARSAAATIPLLIGRALFGGFFLYNGINHFMKRGMLTEYARSKGVPFAEVAVPASGLALALGGLSVIAGVRPKIGASLVTSFLVAASPQMHAFWKEGDPQKQMNEMVNFTKNLALAGGAMLAAAIPEPWPWAMAAARQPAGAAAPLRG